MANASADRGEALANATAGLLAGLAGELGDLRAEACQKEGDFAVGIAAMVLLFFLIMGLSGSVDILSLRGQLRRKTGILCGLCCQFILMPFISFAIIKLIHPPRHVGLTLMILLSSPGGAYSNWWCSLFNADLALSVAMTAVSTLCSAGMLPLNLMIYVHLLYGEVVDIPWRALVEGLAIVLSAITTGIFISTLCPKWKHCMSFLGNVSGICMIALTAWMSVAQKSDTDEIITAPWEKEWWFYGVVAAPFAASLLASLLVSSCSCLRLSRPERMAITIEACYQNVGIASAVALAAFCGSPKEMSDALAVPLLYGGLEAACLAAFCLIGWKAGWTYAPADAYLCQILGKSYQPSQGGGEGEQKQALRTARAPAVGAAAVARAGEETSAAAAAPAAAEAPGVEESGKPASGSVFLDVDAVLAEMRGAAEPAAGAEARKKPSRKKPKHEAKKAAAGP